MLIFNLPTNKADLQKTKQLSIEIKKKGERVPYFKDEQGRLFYWDHKGKGNYSLKNLGDKYAENAAYRARRLAATATSADFEKAWGKLGKEMFKIEARAIRDIYRNNPSGHDVDHIQSLKAGGVHHSRNLRSIPAIQNRSRGAMDIGSRAKTNLMIGDTPQQTIKIQGPAMTPAMVAQQLVGESRVSGKNLKIRQKQTRPVASDDMQIQSNIENFGKKPKVSDYIYKGADKVAGFGIV